MFNPFAYLLKYHTWLILAVIIGFSCAAVYSCIQILEEEERVIESYKYKTVRIHNIEDDFHDLEAILHSYFMDQETQISLQDVSERFVDFQEQFIFFHSNAEHMQHMFQHNEVTLINDIQSHIQKLVPEILKAQIAERGDLPSQVQTNLKRIEKSLDDFRHIQTHAEEDLLSSDLMKERRNRVFVAIAMLGCSGAFLILFLVYKNNQLEESNRRQEEAFRLANERIRAIEASSDGIGIMDTEKRLVYINDALAHLHGIPIEAKQEYLGQNWTTLYNDTGRREIEKNVYPVLDHLGKWRGEALIKRKDDLLIEAELSLTMLPDNSGMIGTARDITERKEAEKENKNLQSQVHQAQKMEAIGRLAGGIAHDFNNILAAINGYAEFLSEDLEKDKTLKSYADNILNAGQKARALIDQMLSFSRRAESRKSILDIREVIDETVSMINPALPKSIEMDVQINCDYAAYVRGDSSLITQALMNIIVNAIDAIGDERGTLSVLLNYVEPDEDEYDGMLQQELPSAHEMPHISIQQIGDDHMYLELGRLKRGAGYFQLSITDTGSGMKREVMEHIFEPFFTTKPVDKGTGLGMANVHGALTAHHGAMVIDSVLEHGTTFDLFFPMSDHIDDPSVINGERIVEQKTDFSGLRVLVVDDQKQVLDMLETMLTRQGIECTAMENSLEALEYLKEHHEAFDLVITDQNMPKMTGLELIAESAEISETLPFIIVSGYSKEKLNEMRMTCPSIKECLRKPVKKEVLLKAIERALRA